MVSDFSDMQHGSKKRRPDIKTLEFKVLKLENLLKLYLHVIFK